MDLATGLLRLLPGARAPEQQPESLAVCQSCASTLVQPQGWHELPDGRLILDLRCPECFVCTTGSFDPQLVADYDERLVKGRQSMVADYELVLRHNMQELSESFERALELDLIGPDDFACAHRVT